MYKDIRHNIDSAALQDLIRQSGYKKEWIAAQLGITREGFRGKCAGRTSFKAREVDKLQELLRFDDQQRKQIFSP